MPSEWLIANCLSQVTAGSAAGVESQQVLPPNPHPRPSTMAEPRPAFGTHSHVTTVQPTHACTAACLAASVLHRVPRSSLALNSAARRQT